MWRIISDHKRDISIVDSNTIQQSSDVLKDENNKWNVDFDMNKKQQSLLFVWTTELNEIKNKIVCLFLCRLLFFKIIPFIKFFISFHFFLVEL